MATSNLIGKKIVLKYVKGTFTFSDILQTADNDKMYNLANIINSFQDEQPPVKIVAVSTHQII